MLLQVYQYRSDLNLLHIHCIQSSIYIFFKWVYSTQKIISNRNGCILLKKLLFHRRYHRPTVLDEGMTAILMPNKEEKRLLTKVIKLDVGCLQHSDYRHVIVNFQLTFFFFFSLYEIFKMSFALLIITR